MGWTWWQKTTEDGNQVRARRAHSGIVAWYWILLACHENRKLDVSVTDMVQSHSLKMTRQALWIGVAKWIQSAAPSPLFTDVGDSGPNMVILIIKNRRWHKGIAGHSFIWSHKYTANKLSPATNWFSPQFWYLYPLPHFLKKVSFLTCYNTFLQAVTYYLTSSYLDSWCESGS